MNVISQLLDTRDDGEQAQNEADDLWLRERAGIDPAARRESWRRWLRRELEKTLQWPKKADARERLIGQCVAELTTLARQLRGRGWLLDGEALAVHVRTLIGPVAKAQRAGKVGDFWPYFRAAVRAYVGANAEEIQQHAKRTGADEGALSMAGALAGLGIGKTKLRGPSMTEIVSDRAAEIAAKKALQVRNDAAQGTLL